MNHDMKAFGEPPDERADGQAAGRASLRTRQQDATRASIVDAFLKLSHDGNAVRISMPMVAEQAGLSVRTVYRYFPTKDDLQTAAANFFNDRVSNRLQSGVDTSNFDTYLKALWTDFAAELPAVMAEHATPAGRRLRATRLPIARETVRRAVGPDAADETVDLLVAVTSSSMFIELADRMGHPPEAAVAMVARLVRLLLASEQPAPTDPATPTDPTNPTDPTDPTDQRQ